MFGRNKVLNVQEVQELLRKKWPATTEFTQWQLDDRWSPIMDKEWVDRVTNLLHHDIDPFKSLHKYPQDYQDLMIKVVTEYFDQQWEDEEKRVKQQRKIMRIQKESEADYIKEVVENKVSITDTTPKELVQKIEQIKKKEDYIDEKSKLTEKQLLAEIVVLLENIRDNAKINSETMNDKLDTISSTTLDSKYELQNSREDDKARHKENRERTSEWHSF